MIPDVLLAEDDLLVIAWVEAVAPASAHQEDLGRSLAALHNRSWSDWGGGSSWIGECPVDPRPALTGPEFYRRRLTDLAARCGLSQPVAAVTNRLSELVPPADPALLHGDLWWGNVVWAPSGRVCLIDPSVHGGHPEEDLAMLALFGPIPPVVYAAYEEVSPLDDGWEGRVAFWQLYPLLVHTVLFGGSYRGQVETAARRFA
jgi:fructosamine-3-kinase